MTGLPLAAWLWWHSRHGTGPIRKTVRARALDKHGQAHGEERDVTFYRCECTAVRRLP